MMGKRNLSSIEKVKRNAEINLGKGFEYEYKGEYDIRNKTYCRQAISMEGVGNLTEARKECSHDTNCGMFVDNGGLGTKFYSCTPDANVYKTRTSKSITYLKSK